MRYICTRKNRSADTARPHAHDIMAHIHNSTPAHHHHHVDPTHVTRALVWGIALNLIFVAIELGAGLWQRSMGLISDAGHNLSDVVSLLLALLAVKLSQTAMNDKYTYGYRKSTILVSLIIACILIAAIGAIVWESIQRLLHPQPVDGGVVAWVAGIGIIVNAFTAWLFMKDSKEDLNIKGAYLHMVADTLVSVGVLISGVIISRTGWYVIDPLIAITVAAVIFVSTWGLLRASVRLTLDGVPDDIDIGQVRKAITTVDGVKAMHHLHVWALSTTENAVTVHVVISAQADAARVKYGIKHALSEVGIDHTTIEIETEGETCCDDLCHREAAGH